MKSVTLFRTGLVVLFMLLSLHQANASTSSDGSIVSK